MAEMLPSTCLRLNLGRIVVGQCLEFFGVPCSRTVEYVGQCLENAS